MVQEGEGKEDLLKSIILVYKKQSYYEKFKLNYEELELFIAKLQNKFIPYATNISPR